MPTGRMAAAHRPRPIDTANRRQTLFTSLLQPSHLILIAIVALVFLGPKRIPEAGRSLGQGLKEFKNSIAGAEEGPQLPTTNALTDKAGGTAPAEPRSAAAYRD